MKYHQKNIVEVNRRLGTVKQPYFDEIVDKIIESIF